MIVAPSVDTQTGPVSFCLPLDALGTGAAHRMGNKAATLARLRADGLPVPGGFCVTSRAYREWLAGCPEAAVWIDDLERLDREDVEAMRRGAAALRTRLAEVPVPPAVAEAILGACASRQGGGAWAVRSSAAAEDGRHTSFAGQHDTLLNVRGSNAVFEAVRACWISLFTDRAVAYRLRNRLPQHSTAMAVLVQEMVPAESAGVVFTADPITGQSDRLIIEATRGLGDVLVSGAVDPERCVVHRRTREILARAIPPGPAGVAPNLGLGEPADAGASDRSAGGVLDAELIRRLVDLAVEVEARLGEPQDIEWASAGGQLYLLQARPVTGIPLWRTPTPDVWTNANMCENLPEVLTPMGWSVFESLLVGLFRSLLGPLGVDLDARPWFGLVAGRVYLNLTVTREVFGGLALFVGEDLSEILGGFDWPAGRGSVKALPIRRVLRRPAQLLLLFQMVRQFLSRAASARATGYLQVLRARMDDLTATQFTAMPDTVLADFIPTIRSTVYPEASHPAALAPAIACLTLGFASSMALLRFARGWLDDPDGAAVKRLLGATGNMEPATVAVDLWRLAGWMREHAQLARVLDSGRTFAELRPELEATAPGREFLERWRVWMMQHGHHARGEMDIAIPRWAERPDDVLDLLRGYLGAGSTTGTPLRLPTDRGERQTLLESCRRRLRNPIKRWLFATLLDRARHGLAMRENVKNQAVRGVVAIRRALFEAGDRLVRRGIVDARGDVFFLTLTELGELLTLPAGFDVRRRIGARRAEFNRHRTLRPPPTLGLANVENPAGRAHGRASVEAPAPRPPSGDTAAELVEGPPARWIGLAVSPGIAVGKARVLLEVNHHQRLLPGEILVAPATDPGWTPYFLGAAAIVVDIGGQLSHGSILAREFGIPAVVNVGDATRRIRTGQRIRVDGDRGVVTVEG